jgi:hypothetical protein
LYINTSSHYYTLTPKSRINNARNNAQKKCDRNQLRSLQDARGTRNYQTWANSDEAVEARLMAIAKWQAEMSSTAGGQGLHEADKLSAEMSATSISEGKERGREHQRVTMTRKVGEEHVRLKG